jgi:hypothetical protein
VELDRISLREQERGLIVGGVEAGKSTLEEALVADFFWRYPKSLILILDSKPRFKAQYEPSGMVAKRRYKNQDHGPRVPGSVVIDDPGQLPLLVQMGFRILIAHANNSAEFVRLVATADAFYDHSRSSIPHLLVVDETIDFFRQNGSPIGGDALIRAARAGRERGVAALYCAQRLRSFNSQIMEYLMKLYRFRTDSQADLKRLTEMGAPLDMAVNGPRVQQVFDYWTKLDYDTVYGPYKLALGARPKIPAGVEAVTLPRYRPDATTPAPAVSSWRRRRAGV